MQEHKERSNFLKIKGSHWQSLDNEYAMCLYNPAHMASSSEKLYGRWYQAAVAWIIAMLHLHQGSGR